MVRGNIIGMVSDGLLSLEFCVELALLVGIDAALVEYQGAAQRWCLIDDI
jgi:hypothetical protein